MSGWPAVAQAPSTAPVVANAQQLPQCLWFLTPVTATMPFAFPAAVRATEAAAQHELIAAVAADRVRGAGDLIVHLEPAE